GFDPQIPRGQFRIDAREWSPAAHRSGEVANWPRLRRYGIHRKWSRPYRGLHEGQAARPLSAGSVAAHSDRIPLYLSDVHVFRSPGLHGVRVSGNHRLSRQHLRGRGPTWLSGKSTSIRPSLLGFRAMKHGFPQGSYVSNPAFSKSMMK